MGMVAHPGGPVGWRMSQPVAGMGYLPVVRVKIVKTWHPCSRCRRPVHEREVSMRREEFVRVYVTNVILTEPWDGPQVDAGEFHHCEDPQPYEIRIPDGVW